MIILRLSSKRVLLWTHGRLTGNLFLRLMKKYFHKIPDALLLYGNGYLDDLRRVGINSSNMYVVYNSLDYDQQVRERAKLSPELLAHTKEKYFITPSLPTIVFIGRLTIRKRLDKLVYACAALERRGMEVNVMIIGEGESRKDLEILAKSLNVDKYICFYGESYEESDTAKLIASADVCVSPGDVGLTSIHCMSYGTPVITHNNRYKQMPEYESIFEGKTGALFNYGDENSMIDTIYDWLSTKDREETRLSCYRIIDERYTPSHQATVINNAVTSKL